MISNPLKTPRSCSNGSATIKRLLNQNLAHRVRFLGQNLTPTHCRSSPRERMISNPLKTPRSCTEGSACYRKILKSKPLAVAGFLQRNLKTNPSRTHPPGIKSGFLQKKIYPAGIQTFASGTKASNLPLKANLASSSPCTMRISFGLTRMRFTKLTKSF